MKKAASLLLFILPLVGQAAGADKAALQTKNKSSFELGANSRDPFWPIGWKPTARLTGKGSEGSGDIPLSAFAVTSITLGEGQHFAIVNGKVMQEGQQFGLRFGSQTFQVTVKAIEDGRVVLSRHDQEIVVPLRRK